MLLELPQPGWKSKDLLAQQRDCVDWYKTDLTTMGVDKACRVYESVLWLGQTLRS